jgi:ankyrin repeat protein
VSGGPAAAPFSLARQAIEAGDVKALADLLESRRDVCAMEGEKGNGLLGMATRNGDAEAVRLLLGAGADVAHANAHGWTALHQAAYGNDVQLAELLLTAGAPTDAAARGEGGTPLIAALFWGHVEVTEVLVCAGVEPRNLRAAAGIGDVRLLGELAGSSQAGSHRAFYRPHSGFPAWSPTDDPQEVLDEALAYAARSGRVAALDALVEYGARVEEDVYRGTPLLWAASKGRSAAVERLIELGADPSGRGDYGGEDHGSNVTPLHLAAAGGHSETVQILLGASADAAVVDGHGYGTPAEWARHEGNGGIAELIERAL